MRILNWLIKDKCPSLVFLMETKCNTVQMDTVKRRLHFDNCFVMDSLGRNGGLALLWKQEFYVIIQSYSRWHVNALVKDINSNLSYTAIRFYGHLETSKRELSWSLLKLLHSNICGPGFIEILMKSPIKRKSLELVFAL